MKLGFLLFLIITGIIYPHINFAQAPNFGAANNFVLFTSEGAVGNTSTSHIWGNIGSNAGDITGFAAPTTLAGTSENTNATTSQAKTDLLAAYNQLYNTATTVSGHAAGFGNGETLAPGVYSINQAAAVNGILYLDAGNNPGGVFIFKVNGALTTGAATTIIMQHQTVSGNVFWIAEGAIAMGANTVMVGTLIAHQGAISMGATGKLDGRMYSTKGAVAVYADSIAIPTSGGYTLPVKLTSFSGICDQRTIKVNWSTASEINNKYFLLENSANSYNWKTVATISGAGTSSLVSNYNISYPLTNNEANYFRLTQVDNDGNYKQSAIINVQGCASKGKEDLIIFPNPSAGNINLQFDGDKNKIKFTAIFNAVGKKVFENYGYQSTINLSAALPGVYYVKLQTSTGTISKEVVIKRH